MIYKTKITPGRELNSEEIEIVENKLRLCTEIHKTTDGTRQTLNGHDQEHRIVIREWTTMEAAEDWINFYSQFSPTQAEIIVKE